MVVWPGACSYLNCVFCVRPRPIFQSSKCFFSVSFPSICILQTVCKFQCFMGVLLYFRKLKVYPWFWTEQVRALMIDQLWVVRLCAELLFQNAGLHSSFSLILAKKNNMHIVVSYVYCLLFSLRLGIPLKVSTLSFFRSNRIELLIQQCFVWPYFRGIIKLTAPLTSWWHRASCHSRTLRQRWLWLFSQKLWISFQEFQKLTNIELNASSFW